MSAISLKSITGITSITTPAGVDNQLTLHNNNTNEAVKLDIAGNLHINNQLAVTGISTFTGISDHSSRLQMFAGNPIRLLNDANSAHCEIDCYGGAGFRLTSYNHTMFTCENGSSTKFYTNNGTSRLEISNGGDVLVVTGTLHIPDALQHYGDTNTKIRFPANDTITAETGGSERLRIASDGKVGIGTAVTPTHQLHIIGSGNVGGVRIENSHSTTTVSGNTAATAFPHNLVLSNYSGLASTNDRMVSIGFDVPTTGSYANATIAYQATASGAGDFQFWLESGNNSYERLRITSGGRLGLGLASPQAVMHIEGGSEGNLLQLSNTFTGATNTDGFVMGINSSLTYLYNRENKDITFGTNNTERFRIDSNGRVVIGHTQASTNYGKLLHIHNSASAGASLHLTDSTTGTSNSDGFEIVTHNQAAYLVQRENSHMIFMTNGTNERLRILSDGKVLIGHTSNIFSYKLAVFGTDGGNSGIAASRFSNNTSPASLLLSKSRGTSIGSYTIVQDDDEVGMIDFRGADGSDNMSKVAEIKASIDGTPGSNDMPGRLTFHTTADGASTSTERLRIHSDGDVSIGSVVGDHRLTIRKDSTITNFTVDNDPAEASGMAIQNYSFSVGRYSALSFHACNSSTVQIASILGVSVASGTAADLRFTVRDSNTSTAEVMRMSGADKAFLVGTTHHRTAEFSHPDGFSIRGDTSKGQFQNTVTSVMGGLMNRDGSNGAILGFRREGVGVGHIGVDSSTMYLNFGGTTAAANQLDDYEEGSWTPTATNGASGIVVYASRYTKVGNKVFIDFRGYLTGTNSGDVRIGGLPYANLASNAHNVGPVMHNGFDYSGGTEPVAVSYITGTNSYFQLYYSQTNSNGWQSVTGSNTNGQQFITSLTYFTS